MDGYKNRLMVVWIAKIDSWIDGYKKIYEKLEWLDRQKYNFEKIDVWLDGQEKKYEKN